uniref:RadC family protein n=1 Tax=Elioraea rosea TaxID=2492390 RepID=UPI001184CFC4
VLVVDDEPAISRVLLRTLRARGIGAISAQSADEALEIILSAKSIHVVVSDINMPAISGITLGEEIQMRLDPRDAIEVIFITGRPTADNAISALRIRAFEFFAKPFRLADVADAITRALASAEQKRRAARAQAPVTGFADRQARLDDLDDATRDLVERGYAPSGFSRAVHRQARHEPPPESAPLSEEEEAAARYAAVLAGSNDTFDDEMLLDCLLKLAPDARGRVASAKALLATFGGYAEVLAASPRELSRHGGLTDQQATHLKAVHASAVRLLRARVARGATFRDWDALSAYLYASLADQKVESVKALFLNTKNMLLADETLATGTVDFVSIHPREIVKRALDLSATSLIVVHNHPSGDPSPSSTDIELTRSIMQACDLVGVKLLDHVIVGRGGVRSLAALGHLTSSSAGKPRHG